MSYFDNAILAVLIHEGNYSFDRNDPGGETRWGICKRNYPHLDIKGLTKDEAINIYRRDYWRPYYDKMPYQIAAKVFDMSVNMGHGQSHRILQRALDIVDDGIIGPATIAATNEQPLNQVLKAISAEQMAVYHQIVARRPESKTFLDGWSKRAYWVPDGIA